MSEFKLLPTMSADPLIGHARIWSNNFKQLFNILHSAVVAQVGTSKREKGREALKCQKISQNIYIHTCKESQVPHLHFPPLSFLLLLSSNFFRSFLSFSFTHALSFSLSLSPLLFFYNFFSHSVMVVGKWKQKLICTDLAGYRKKPLQGLTQKLRRWRRHRLQRNRQW